MSQSAEPATPATWRSQTLPTLAGGIALWLAFYLPPLAFVGLAPFAVLAQQPGALARRLAVAYLGGLAFFLPGVHWLRYCDDAAWLAWLLLAGYLALYLPALVFAISHLHKSLRVPMWIALPMVWTTLEYVRAHALTGFGWLFLAHNLATWTPTIQIADIGGVYAVSFFVAMINGLIADIVWGWSFPTRKGRLEIKLALFACLVATLAIHGYGVYRIQTADFRPGPTVLLIQTAIPQSLKNKDPDETHKLLIRSLKGVESIEADLVLWPETSYPFGVGTIAEGMSDLDIDRVRLSRRPDAHRNETPDAEIGERIRANFAMADQDLGKAAKHFGKPTLVGGIRHQFEPDRYRLYNSSMLFDPQKGLVGKYDKIHLVPFGEYLPLEKWTPILRRLISAWTTPTLTRPFITTGCVLPA